MKGIDLGEARATERGLEHDRRWMVVDLAGEFFTQRSHPRLATIWTELVDGRARALRARRGLGRGAPGPRIDGAGARARLEQHLRRIARLARVDAWLSEYSASRAAWSTCPTARGARRTPPTRRGRAPGGLRRRLCLPRRQHRSLEDLNKRLARAGTRPLPMNRFRPNIVSPARRPTRRRVGESSRWRSGASAPPSPAAAARSPPPTRRRARCAARSRSPRSPPIVRATSSA
jgi:uncharacterized protein YcbX